MALRASQSVFKRNKRDNSIKRSTYLQTCKVLSISGES